MFQQLTTIPAMLVVAALVLAADRVSKARVAKQRGSSPARFCESRRAGVALVLLWVAALTGILFAAGSGRLFQSVAARIGAAAALIGAASNLYDRLRRGAVTDFIVLGWWPAFNLADVAITVGALAAICFL